jgi:site-specific DNA-adenine methylase
MNNLIYLWQNVYYGLLRPNYKFDYNVMPQTINFTSHYDSERDLHWLESSEFPELYVTGHNKEELARNVTDTLLVYFDVPTYFARKFKPDNQTFSFENQKTGEREYVSLDYIDELRRATV